MPNYANPQSLNRYSYVNNSPLNHIDPTGHVACQTQEDCLDMGTTPGGGFPGPQPGPDPDPDYGDDDNELNLNFDTRDICNYGDCSGAATVAGLGATALDAYAFGMNLTFMAIVDVSAAIGFPMSLGPALVAYELVSPIPNIIGTAGGVLWGVQGILLGSNYIEGGVTLSTGNGLTVNEVQLSGGISQDTIVAGSLDGSSWLMPEPNSATVVSGAGLTYDILRNPLAPSLSSAPPTVPTVLNPNFVVSYDFTSNSGSVLMSPFPP